MSTDTKSPDIKTRDWNAWLCGEGERRHLACGEPPCTKGVGAERAAYCGKTIRIGRVGVIALSRLRGQLCEVCEMMHVSGAACSPACPRRA